MAGTLAEMQATVGQMSPEATTSLGMGDQLHRDAVATFLQQWSRGERRPA